MASPVELKSNSASFRLPNNREQTEEVLNELLEKGTIQGKSLNISEALDYLCKLGELSWADSCAGLSQRALCLLHYNAFRQDIESIKKGKIASPKIAWEKINDTAAECLSFKSISDSKEYNGLVNIMNKYGKMALDKEFFFIVP